MCAPAEDMQHEPLKVGATSLAVFKKEVESETGKVVDRVVTRPVDRDAVVDVLATSEELSTYANETEKIRAVGVYWRRTKDDVIMRTTQGTGVEMQCPLTAWRVHHACGTHGGT